MEFICLSLNAHFQKISIFKSKSQEIIFSFGLKNSSSVLLNVQLHKLTTIFNVLKMFSCISNFSSIHFCWCCFAVDQLYLIAFPIQIQFIPLLFYFDFIIVYYFFFFFRQKTSDFSLL